MGICNDTAASSRMLSMYYRSSIFLNNYNNRKGKKNPYEVARTWNDQITMMTKTLSALWPGETYGLEMINPRPRPRVSLTMEPRGEGALLGPGFCLWLGLADPQTQYVLGLCACTDRSVFKGGKREHWWARLSAGGWILRFLRILE